MNGLTATGVTVGICAGLWQLVSSHVGLSQGWELLGTIGFVAFCSFMPQAAVNRGLSEVWRLIIPGWCGRFRRADCWLAGLCKWTVRVLGERNYYRTLLGGSGLARAFLVTVLYSRWLSRHDAVFASGMNWTVTLLGFLAGNCVG